MALFIMAKHVYVMLNIMFSKKLVINTLCEFGPIVAFIIAFEIWGFQAGTIAMMVAVSISLITLKSIENHIPLFALLSTITVLVFGGLSLLKDIPSIFILRDTIFDGLFGISLLISVYVKKPLFQYLFKNVFAITQTGWRKLSFRWGVFFIFLALANEWVRLTLSPETWVVAKMGIILASFIFGMSQLLMTKKERLPSANAWGIAT